MQRKAGAKGPLVSGAMLPPRENRCIRPKGSLKTRGWSETKAALVGTIAVVRAETTPCAASEPRPERLVIR